MMQKRWGKSWSDIFGWARREGKKLVVEAWMVYALWGKRGMEYWIMQGIVGACESS